LNVEISSKEGIQETCVTLLGMVSGIACANWLDGDATLIVIFDFVARCNVLLVVGSQFGTWVVFILLTLLHVFANLKGMACLVLTSVNRTRATKLIQSFLLPSVDHWLSHFRGQYELLHAKCTILFCRARLEPREACPKGAVPTPQEAKVEEGLSWLWEDGLGDKTVPLVSLGQSPVAELIKSQLDLERLSNFSSKKYACLVLPIWSEGSAPRVLQEVKVAFSVEATNIDRLFGLFHAQLLRMVFLKYPAESITANRAPRLRTRSSARKPHLFGPEGLQQQAMSLAESLFPDFVKHIKGRGWQIGESGTSLHLGEGHWKFSVSHAHDKLE